MLYFFDAKRSFEKAQTVAHDMGYIESHLGKFCHHIATIIPETVDVDMLILAVKIAIADYEDKNLPYANFIALIPHFVREYSSKEFAHEFREKYNSEILGLTQEKLPDVDYGYTEVKKDVIDISEKDRYEVFAALYNASTPIGMGFAQYNPMTWTKEMAQYFYEKCGMPTGNGGMSFKYVFGRPLNCLFDTDDTVIVHGYNNDNEEDLAQRAISTCPNKPKVKEKK